MLLRGNACQWSCQWVLTVLLLASAAHGLQPLPTARPRSSSSDNFHLYSEASFQLGVFPCNTSSALQRFALNGSVFTLADGRCLARDASSFNGVTVGPCTGQPATQWSLVPCTAAGCSGNQTWLQSALDEQVGNMMGAVGPWMGMWTVDNPTGVCHNELWAWSSADSTLRSLNIPCNGGPPTLNECLTVVPPPPPPPQCTAARRVDCWTGRWASAPRKTPAREVSDGPLLGNGDLGAVLAAPTGGTGGFTWWLGKADMWATNTDVDSASPALHSDTFYTAIAAGSLTVAPADGTAKATSWTAAQALGSATVSANASFAPSAAAGGSPAGGSPVDLRLQDAYIAAGEGALVLPLSVSADVLLNVTLQQATAFQLPLGAGVVQGDSAPAGAWALYSTKGGVLATDNSLILMPCDTQTYVIHPSINTWTTASSAFPGQVVLANGTGTATPGPPLLCPKIVPGVPGSASAATPRVSIGPCSGEDASTAWVLSAPSTAPGAPPASLELRSAANASLCAYPVLPEYHNSGGRVALGPCSAQGATWWSGFDGTQLRFNASQCLTAVPPNVNVTLGLAAVVVESATGAVVPLAAPLPPSTTGTPSHTHTTTTATTAPALASSTVTIKLSPGVAYTLVLTAVTTWDTQWGADPLEAALEALRKCAGPSAPTQLAALEAEHGAYWGTFWNASEVNLGGQRTLLESFWYGANYLLGMTAKPGKIAPGLWGVFAVTDLNGWNGDYTLESVPSCAAPLVGW
jgi:hypothetical protein